MSEVINREILKSEFEDEKHSIEKDHPRLTLTVDKVTKDSVLDGLLQPGDVIVGKDKKDLLSAEEFWDTIKYGVPCDILVIRNRQEVTVSIPEGARQSDLAILSRTEQLTSVIYSEVEKIEVSRRKCLYIKDVIDGSPSDEAGLQEGDKIIKIKGTSIVTSNELNEAAANNSEFAVTVIRDKRVITLQVKPKDGKVGCLFYPGETVTKRTEDGVEYRVFQMWHSFTNIKNEEIFRFILGKVDEPTGYKFNQKNIRGDYTGNLLSNFTIYSESLPNGYDCLAAIMNGIGVDDCPIVCSDGVLGGYYSTKEKNILVESEPRSLVFLFTVSHELTHARQHKDSSLKKLMKMYGFGNKFSQDKVWDYYQRRRLIYSLNEILKLFPTLVEVQNYEKMTTYIEEQLSILNDDEKDDSNDKVLQDEILSFEVEDNITVRDILKVPEIFLERDADGWALKCIRKMQQETGIDFFQEYPIKTYGDDGSLVDDIDSIKKAVDYHMKIIGSSKGTRELVKRVVKIRANNLKE